MTFELKISDGCVQVCEDQRVVTVRRIAPNSNVQRKLDELEIALMALREAAQAVVHEQNRQRVMVLTDHFHR